jgi:hypothetical protein
MMIFPEDLLEFIGEDDAEAVGMDDPDPLTSEELFSTARAKLWANLKRA